MGETWKRRGNRFELDWKIKLALIILALLVFLGIGLLLGAFAGVEISKSMVKNQTTVVSNISNVFTNASNVVTNPENKNNVSNSTILQPPVEKFENISINKTSVVPKQEENRTVTIANGIAAVNFRLTDESLRQFNYSLDDLNRGVNEGNYGREIIRQYRKGVELPQLYEQFGTGRVNRFNYSGFIQPFIHISTLEGSLDLDNYLAFEDLEGIKPLAEYVKSKSKRDYDFVKNVLYLKSQLGNYSYGIGKPMYPLENFLVGNGDSGDAAIFVGSMIKSVHPEWKVRLYAVNSNNIGMASEIIDHFILYVDNGYDVQAFIETTSDDPTEAMQYYSGSTIAGWYFNF